jgi:hypothetical protein
MHPLKEKNWEETLPREIEIENIKKTIKENHRFGGITNIYEAHSMITVSLCAHQKHRN